MNNIRNLAQERQRLRIGCIAAYASRREQAAMQVVNRDVAGSLVQVIDVLRDATEQAARCLESRQGKVTGMRLSEAPPCAGARSASRPHCGSS